jgi:ribosomal protein S18 acetylase RimI-like enzyme
MATARREIRDHAELAARCDGDLLCLWTAQGHDGRSRAWASADGRAVAVAGRALSRRDRLAVRGPAESVIPLAADVLAEIGPGFRPLGERPLIETVAAAIPGLAVRGTFGWMDTRDPVPDPPAAAPAAAAPATAAAGPPAAASPAAAESAGWLPAAALPEVTALLEEGFPDSYAWPGKPGVERWAGVRDATGRLAAVAALAWSAPDAAMISGVAVHPAARGRRLGRTVCEFLTIAGLRRHSAVVLMVEEWNQAARRLYGSLGLHYRDMAAASLGSG